MEEKSTIPKKIPEEKREHTPPRRDEASAIFGYILMSVAILAFLGILLTMETGHASCYTDIEVPIIFFITMLGFVCIHPDLLKDAGKNLSTMRVVVFMMVNVISMLMLRIGWNSPTFNAIGMTGYWVTIIGFVFGSKVAQSYIENKYPAADGLQADAAAGETTDPTTQTADDPASAGGGSLADVAKMAADQHRAQLMDDHENINSVSDTVSYVNDVMTSVVAIYLSNGDTSGIPATLDAALTGGGTQSIPTEIITNVGKPQIQMLQHEQIWGNNTPHAIGSAGPMVGSADKDFKGVLTSGHVYSAGLSTSVGDILEGDDRPPVSIGGRQIASWHFQLISEEQDLAIAQLNSAYPGNSISFSGGCYSVGHGDVLKTQVSLSSAMCGDRTGYIIDYNVPETMTYKDNVDVNFTNVILIGSVANRNDSQPLSQGGDSGGAVYIDAPVGKKLVGLILGGDEKYTFVLPVQETLKAWNFNLL